MWRLSVGRRCASLLPPSHVGSTSRTLTHGNQLLRGVAPTRCFRPAPPLLQGGLRATVLRSQKSSGDEFLSEIDRIISSVAADGSDKSQVQSDPAAPNSSSKPAVVKEHTALLEKSNQVYQLSGRRPRLLLASFHSQPGLGRKEDELAPGLADVGFDCDISPASRTPQDVCRMAVEADVHAIVLIASPPVSGRSPAPTTLRSSAKTKPEVFTPEEEAEKLREDLTHIHELQAALQERSAEDVLLLYVTRSAAVPKGLGDGAVSGVQCFPSTATASTIASSVLRCLLEES